MRRLRLGLADEPIEDFFHCPAFTPLCRIKECPYHSLEFVFGHRQNEACPRAGHIADIGVSRPRLTAFDESASP